MTQNKSAPASAELAEHINTVMDNPAAPAGVFNVLRAHYLSLVDGEGRERASLCCMGVQVVFTMFDTNDEPRLTLRVDGDGAASVNIFAAKSP